MAEAAIRETGMEYALVRPSWIYGPGDRSMNRFVAFCRYLPVVPVIGDGRTPVYPIFVGDVARVRGRGRAPRGLQGQGLRPRADPNASAWTTSSAPSRRCWASAACSLHHPAGLMKLLVLPMALLPEPLLSPGAIDFILQEVDMDPKPAQDYFGFAFQKLEEGLRTYLP